MTVEFRRAVFRPFPVVRYLYYNPAIDVSCTKCMFIMVWLWWGVSFVWDWRP